MITKKLKSLAVVLACIMTLGTMPPSTGSGNFLPVTTTVEAATKTINLKASNKKVYVGKTTKISAKATKGARLSYKTSNKKIATVNSKGVIKGKKAGTVKITITAKKSKYKTVKKTITVKVYRQKQKITASSVKLTTGQRRNLGAKARTRLAYKSSNPKVVTVDKKGNLTAKKTGTAKITVTALANNTYNKTSRTITVTVVKKSIPKQTESVKPALPPKQTETARPTEPPKQTEPPKETETEAPAPTEPPKETETEAPKPTEPPKETEAPSPTEPPKETEVPGPTEEPAPNVSYVTEMHFNETSKSNTVYIGEPKASALEWTATGDTTLKDFVFTSSDPSIATVDENGTITGVSVGDVRITAKSKTPFSASGTEDDCLSATYKYHIKVRTTDIDSMYYPEITGEDAITEKNIAVGETKSCTLKITSMGKGSLDDIEFSSSDPETATVDEKGRVTGKKKGYVTITAKTKLPSEMDGQTILTSSTTYHIGDYTYEEVLNGLTMDKEAGQAAHEVMNDLRQNPEHRNFFKDDPSFPTREWDEGILRNAATRASRNIICVMLGGWKDGEKSSINPLASHGGAFNGYGGDGWESTGKDLGAAASVFFEDAGHYGNETDPYFKYEAVAVVQYKNAAGVNLTSMIVAASPCSYEEGVKNCEKEGTTPIASNIKISQIPENEYYDFCNHFGIPTTDTVNNEATPMLNLTDSDEIFTDGSDIHENEPVLTDPAPAVAESEEAVFESEEPDSEEIDIEDSGSVDEEINITEENEE